LPQRARMMAHRQNCKRQSLEPGRLSTPRAEHGSTNLTPCAADPHRHAAAG
jgi:hypothetical protein